MATPRVLRPDLLIHELSNALDSAMHGRDHIDPGYFTRWLGNPFEVEGVRVLSTDKRKPLYLNGDEARDLGYQFLQTGTLNGECIEAMRLGIKIPLMLQTGNIREHTEISLIATYTIRNERELGSIRVFREDNQKIGLRKVRSYPLDLRSVVLTNWGVEPDEQAYEHRLARLNPPRIYAKSLEASAPLCPETLASFSPDRHS